MDFADEKSIYSDSASLLFDGHNQLFESFVRGEGEPLYRDYLAERDTMKELRMRIREFGTNVNISKDRIDELKELLQKRRDSRIEMLKKSGMKQTEIEDIVDEEEFKIMKELKEAKRSYKNSYEQMMKMKENLSQLKVSFERKKIALADRFSAVSSPGRSPNRTRGQTGQLMEEMDGDQDVLDDQEAFDKLETERVMSEDPNSFAFFQAQKTRRALITQNSSNLRSLQKNKRLG